MKALQDAGPFFTFWGHGTARTELMVQADLTHAQSQGCTAHRSDERDRTDEGDLRETRIISGHERCDMHDRIDKTA